MCDLESTPTMTWTVEKNGELTTTDIKRPRSIYVDKEWFDLYPCTKARIRKRLDDLDSDSEEYILVVRISADERISKGVPLLLISWSKKLGLKDQFGLDDEEAIALTIRDSLVEWSSARDGKFTFSRMQEFAERYRCREPEEK